MDDIVEIDNIPGIILENNNDFHYKILYNGKIKDFYKIDGKLIDGMQFMFFHNIRYETNPVILKAILQEISKISVNYEIMNINEIPNASKDCLVIKISDGFNKEK